MKRWQKILAGRLLGLMFGCGVPVAMRADQVLFDWEKSGDAEGWSDPGEKYRADFGLLGGALQTSEKAFSGKGALKVQVNTAAEGMKERRGRLDKYYGGKADWTAFQRFSVMCFAPEGAPDLQGLVAVMSGAWKWSQGRVVSCRAGQWTKLSIETGEIASPEQIQLVMFVVSCPSGEYKGSLYFDRATLEGEVRVEPGKPGVAPKSESGTWNETFDKTEGWERQGGARIEPAAAAAVGAGAASFTLPGAMFKKVDPPKPRVPDASDEGYQGVSFWAKGDGSDQFGTVVLCGAHPLWFPFKYAYAFPLKETAWKKYVVAWRDWIPEDPVYSVGTPGGAPPSNIQYVKVGSKWTITHNNRDLPRFSFSLDHLQLETEAPAEAPAPALEKIENVRAKFAARKPVQVLCIGDSITAGTSLGKPDEERYAQVLERLLRQRLKYDGVSVLSRAVGGAQVNDLRLWAARDFTAVAPDLVTIMVGYNDKSWGYPADYYASALSDYLCRVARQTQGRAAVLLMPPIPGRGARFVMMDDYADAVRKLAAARGVALCDVNKTFKAFGRDGLNEYFADDAHPNAKGHERLAAAIADLLQVSDHTNDERKKP